MLNELSVLQFPRGTLLSANDWSQSFVIETCQRSLVINFNLLNSVECEFYQGIEAYQFLLKVICGLESELLGESEITGQFKAKYQQYLTDPKRESRIIRLLEKLFQDAKEIRHHYLKEISQKTYAGITRQIIAKNRPQKVLIIGSGEMSVDVINQLKKRSQLFISARNEVKIKAICETHKIQSIPWKDINSYLDFDHIVVGIGADTFVLLDHNFMYTWQKTHAKRCLVDLGSPSVIKTELSSEDGVFHLDDILARGVMKEKNKKEKIALALEAIDQLAHKRMDLFAKRTGPWNHQFSHLKSSDLAPAKVY
jgi:glutamyl-tRNA reductase